MPAFRPVYQHEVNIFAHDHILPRAAIYYAAAVHPNSQVALTSLGDPALDVFSTVVLERPGLDAKQAEWVSTLGDSIHRSVDAAKIVSYTPRRVEIAASLDRRGILVLNDTNFPGWLVPLMVSQAKS